MKKPATSRKSRTDWKRVDALRDQNIDFSDTPELTPEMFARAVVRRGLKPVAPKEQLTIRLDSDVLEWYRRQGSGYQTRINALLRAFMQEHRRGRSDEVAVPRLGTPMKQRTPEELSQIFESIAGKGLWVPLTAGTPIEVGPLATVYLRYSDVVSQPSPSEERYSIALGSVPRQGALGVVAFINNILVVGGSRVDVHRALNEKFLPEELKASVAGHKLEQLPRPARAAFHIVFNRVGCLLLMRHLILYGSDSPEDASAPVETVGELALLANEFAQRDTLPAAASPSAGAVALQFVPVWDIYNPPDLAYALPRMFAVLTEILPGADSRVRSLSAKLGIDPSSLTIDGIPLIDFVSVVFGLFAFGSKVEEAGKDAIVFDYRRAFGKAPAILPAAENFVAKRSLTAAEFRRKLGSEAALSQKALFRELKERSFLASGLTTFRHYPLLAFDDNRVAILDLQFVVDLLTSGVYWSIFDSLPQPRRETFRQLWGRLFELYVVGLLNEFYPPLAGFLRADLVYDGGQIDALLDFAGDVVVFEVKSSLLSEAAKREGDWAEFEKQLNLKFVRNEIGEPKAVSQLARCCDSIAAGLVPTAAKAKRVYPVLIGEEPALQSLALNTHLNTIFQKEHGGHPATRPLTVMTISELEEMLPYAAGNVFGWADLLESRFVDGEVIGHSVHQAIYDWRHTKGITLYRNEVLLKRFQEIFQMMKEKYQFQE